MFCCSWSLGGYGTQWPRFRFGLTPGSLQHSCPPFEHSATFMESLSMSETDLFCADYVSMDYSTCFDLDTILQSRRLLIFRDPSGVYFTIVYTPYSYPGF